MNTMKLIRNPARETWPELVKRPYHDSTTIDVITKEILTSVRERGDDALRDYHQKFHAGTSDEIFVDPDFLASSGSYISAALKSAIDVARKNIETFHRSQHEDTPKVETTPGVVCWRKLVPIERVGLYVPGGSAPLISTTLMLGVPAQLAGCKEIVVATPPLDRELSLRLFSEQLPVHPAIAYCAAQLGIQTLLRVGGAQAIAALAFGTSSIKRVDKIFGPGNQYVTAAKKLVGLDGIAVDLPAGPSEVMVLADESAEPSFVAADLLSQAEHGADSQVFLVVDSETVVTEVMVELEKQLEELPRMEIARQALKESRAVLLSSREELIEFANLCGPEHLIVALKQYRELESRIVNAGSVFFGNFSPEAAGDYASGTNHTLPTNGAARAWSGVSLDSFVKKITFQELTQQGLHSLAPAIHELASAEGLMGHSNAVGIRFGRRYGI